LQDLQTLKTEIVSALDYLPPCSLQTLAEFVAFLRAKGGQRPDAKGRIIQLGRLWADTPEITAEDIAEARHEMWGKTAYPVEAIQYRPRRQF
jgi:hypothetical protein